MKDRSAIRRNKKWAIALEARENARPRGAVPSAFALSLDTLTGASTTNPFVPREKPGAGDGAELLLGIGEQMDLLPFLYRQQRAAKIRSSRNQ